MCSVLLVTCVYIKRLQKIKYESGPENVYTSMVLVNFIDFTYRPISHCPLLIFQFHSRSANSKSVRQTVSRTPSNGVRETQPEKSSGMEISESWQRATCIHADANVAAWKETKKERKRGKNWDGDWLQLYSIFYLGDVWL